jgi:NitT/TauT family transport system substrate-binding protein
MVMTACDIPSRRMMLGLLVAAAAFAKPAAAQIPIKFAVDGKFEGPSAFFAVGLDRGYFSAAGLDVSVDTSAGSHDTIARVASGAADVGFADINAMIKFRDQNSNGALKAVFMIYNRPPFAIITRKSRGVLAPKDLEGKRLGAPATDPAFAQWRIFVQANGIDASKVAIENVGFPVREPMLAAGQVDAITGLSFSSYVNLKDRGVQVEDIVVLQMGDYGVDLYGHAVIVNSKFAADKPEAVKSFLVAVLRGLRDTVRNAPAAVDAVIKRNDGAKKEIELERLRIALRDNILTPEVRTNGYGGIDMARLDKAIDQIALTHTFKTKPKSSDVFDAAFLPPAAERRVN